MSGREIEQPRKVGHPAGAIHNLNILGVPVIPHRHDYDRSRTRSGVEQVAIAGSGSAAIEEDADRVEQRGMGIR
jgi:hypothetical protein